MRFNMDQIQKQLSIIKFNILQRKFKRGLKDKSASFEEVSIAILFSVHKIAAKSKPL